MPNKTIGQLPLIPGPAGSNEFAIWNGSKTFRISLDTIKTYSISGLTDNDIYVTGGTYSKLTSTLTLYRNDGVSIPITGISTDDIFLTGGTYDNSLVTLTNNDGSIVDFNIDTTTNKWHIPSGSTLTIKNGFQSFIYGDLYIEGLLNLENEAQLVVLNGDIILSGGTISGSGTTLLVDLPTFDTYTTGGSYDQNTGVITFTNNSGGTFTVSGLYTGSTEIFVTGGTYNQSNGVATFTNNIGDSFNVPGFLTGYTNYYTTGATLVGPIAYFDRTDALSAYTLDLSAIDFTGNTSASCINDLYLSNLHGCSPITMHDSIQSNGSTASGALSFAFGNNAMASGQNSHAEGNGTAAYGDESHAEGGYTVTIGGRSHAEGNGTTAYGQASHSEGLQTTANGIASHAEGNYTTADGNNSHAGGYNSIANGLNSFVHSTNSTVNGARSVIIGGQNITGNENDTVYVPNLTVSTGGTTSIVSVDGTVKTTNLQITNGATNSYVLTSDASGNASWQAPFNSNLYNSNGTLTGARTVNMNGNSLSFQSSVPGANLISLYGSGNSSTSRTYFEMGQRKNGSFASSVFFSTFSPDYNSSLWGSFYAGSAMLSSYHETPGVTGGVGNLYFDLSHYTGSLTDKYFAWHAAPVLTARGLSTEMMRLHVVSDGNGYLGIGTKGVPKQRLHVSGNTLVNGTSVFSAKTTDVVTIYGSGSTSPVFKVQGSSGELFSVTDSLTGSLFSVNDISGLPVLEVFSNNTILMGNYQAPSLNTTIKKPLSSGTNNIYAIPTSGYTGAFFDYTVLSTTGARAGNVMSIWSGSSVQYTDASTNDIGSTTGVTFSVVISGSSAVLQATSASSGWMFKGIVRSI